MMSHSLLISALTIAFGVVSQTARAVDVEESQSPGSFGIVDHGRAASLYVDEQDYPGVIRAAEDLADDVRKVSGIRPDLIRAAKDFNPRPILIGTIGKSTIIDGLVKNKAIDVSPIEGQWESYIIQVVANPMPGVDHALVIVGSDKRGTIYGIYHLCERLGVSPWYWWADVPPRHRDAAYVRAGRYVQGPPKVKYRGIFINDEEPALGQWAHRKFGGVNSKMYAHVFELILRLRGNYLLPAMWGKAFNEDDPISPKLADEYGIVMGTSHHEPMLRAQREWTKHGQGPWNYATNEAVLKAFWRTGVERNKAYESIVTIGMRGNGDEPMVEGGDMAANAALLERIVDDQRALIAQSINPDVTKVPQLWALYKEVLEYYNYGMRVPDDVTLLWCDDNWGNVRRLPTPEERHRSGGAGMYYHFDYVGGPRSYKWLNTNPLPKIWEQMHLTYRYGADRIWIVNVGDLKPMELPIEFFLRLAWDPEAITKDQIDDFTLQWAHREFGPTHAQAIADIVSKYAKYNGWRKPELLNSTTFSLTNYQEAERVEAMWQAITVQAEQIYAQLPEKYRDAYYQLVLYPTKASATVAQMYIAAGRNHLYAKQERASTNDQASRVRQLFELDQQLTDEYHTIAGGKWNHMMKQTRIGYTSWSDPKTNVMPEVVEITVPQTPRLGVAIEGSESAWPGGEGEPKLPPFDSLNQQQYPIDVFNRGGTPFPFAANASHPWIKLSRTAGILNEDQRLWATIDWSTAPIGQTEGTIRISRPGGEAVTIGVTATRASDDVAREARGAVGGLTGPIAIAVERATNHVEANGVRWERIPDYGRSLSGMAVFPVTAASVTPPEGSPRLEYKVFVPKAGQVHVDLVTGPTLNFLPGRGLRVAVSFDDQPPQIIDAYADLKKAERDWGKMVSDNARTMRSTHTLAASGVHTLKVWMVDPGVVLEKLVVHTGDVRPSYFGPPETPAPASPASKPESTAARGIPRSDTNSQIAHAQLLEKARQGRIDVYFLGDSITRRWGATDPHCKAFLANWRENFFGWNAANFGWGGDGVQNILWRIENGELDGVNPKVIVLMAGTNNIGGRAPRDAAEIDAKATEIVAGIEALIETCQHKAPRATIILTGITPRKDVMPIIDRVNQSLTSLADGNRIRHVNINDKLADSEGRFYDGMSTDGLHLDLKGYQMWADALKPILMELLGPPAKEDHAPPPTGDPSVSGH